MRGFSRRGFRPHAALAGLAVLAWVLAAGCSELNAPAAPGPVPAADAQSAAPRAPRGPGPAAAPAPDVPPALPAAPTRLPDSTPTALTLTVWSTEVFSPLQADLGSRVLKQQMDEFRAAAPEVEVRFALKRAYGKGGVVHSLISAGGVAPASLPDVAIVDLTELPAVAEAGLARPLEGLIPAAVTADLYPFADEAGRVGDQLVGLPFEVEVLHLLYSRAGLGSPPLGWTEVLSSGVSYLFAAGHDPALAGANEAVWMHYLAANRGPLRAEDGAAVLQPAALREMLTFYAGGVKKGVIPATVLEYRSEADAWPAFLSGKAGMMAVSSLRYLSSRDLLANTAYAACTDPDGKVFTVASGWAFVVVTRDPERQAAAARLIAWLMEPSRIAAWTRAANRLPPTRRAMAVWGPTDPYAAFARTLLERAAPLPAGPEADQLGRALQRAVREVLAGRSTPGEAAATALAGG